MAMHDAQEGRGGKPSGHRPGTPWIVRTLMYALIVIIAYYVIAEHGAHLLAAWPLLFLLACPLMHFLHGGHGGHKGHGDQRAAGGGGEQRKSGSPQ